MYSDPYIRIGLVGHNGVGKSTVADMLVKDHGFIKDSITKRLKEAVSYYIYGEVHFEPKAIENGRELLCAVGKLFRERGFAPVAIRLWDGQNIVIDDLRLLREADNIRGPNSYIVRVTNPTIDAQYAVMDMRHEDDTVREVDLIDFDYILINTPSLGLEHLRQQITDLIKKIRSSL